MGTIANKIRTAIFGKDVRSSIADGIEVVEQLKLDYNNQVINAGNSNAEIVDSRTDINTGKVYSKTGDRLNEYGKQLLSKTDKTQTDNIQTQINDLVLGAVGSGNNAEVVLARGGETVVNTRFNNIENGARLEGTLYSISGLNWIVGIINTTGGIQAIGNTNIACNGYIFLKKGDYIKLLDINYTMRVAKYTYDGTNYTFVSRSDLITSLVAESDGYYRFQITSTASTGLTNLITQTVNKLMVRKNVLLNTIPEMEAKVNSLLQNLGNQNEVVNFRVTLNCYHSNNDANTVANQDSTYNLYDWGALFLPPNYTKAGTKTRLIIHCHGSGGVINSSTTEPTTILAKNLLKLGYAILEMNGIPDDIATTETAKGKHYGASYSLQSNVKGYQYVVKNYNIYKEVFVTGSSMGGLSSFELVQSGCIEVIAQGAFAPVVDNFKQAYCQPWETYLNQRYRMARYFNFPNFSTFSFTNTQYPSQSEIDYYMANYDKIIGYNPIHKNCVNWSSLNPYNTKNDTPANQTIEDGVYNQLVNLHPVPLKVWHCEDDATVSYRYAKHLVNAIKRGGGIAFYRPFPSGGHSAWDTGDNVNMTDVIGNPLTVKASTYELYQFFKRYELNVA